MTPTHAKLAEDAAIYLLPRPGSERLDPGDFVYDAGAKLASVHRIRLVDAGAAVEWTRSESARRGHRTIEWWLGWSATPADLAGQLLELGLVPDDVPVLIGMTSDEEPPVVPDVEVRRAESLEEHLSTLEVDWDVWEIAAEERAERRVLERARYDAVRAAGVTHLFSAFLDGRRVGFGRAVDMDMGVTLMGGAVLPEARGRGVYRALVRARWEHAVARGTPLLVVQAGAMSAPVLLELGFQPHGHIHLFVDRL